MKPRIARTVPQSVRQPRPGDSAKHLAMVHKMPCCIPGCGNQSGPPHHLLRVGDGAPKGTSRTNPDMWALPVCVGHHVGAPGFSDWLHRHGDDEAWFACMGINARDLAKALWACRLKPDPDQSMARVVSRAKQKVM